MKATDADRKLARASEQLVLLRERGGTILPLLDDAWTRLRGMLATGSLVGRGLSEGSGKTRNLGAAYWSAPPADRAHAYGWVRFAFPPFGSLEEGPCVLVKAEFESLFDVSLSATAALSTASRAQHPPAPADSAPTRTKPKREGVQRALAELYPAGVPDQVELPNHELLRAVAAKLGEKRVPSPETILRAAGRK